MSALARSWLPGSAIRQVLGVLRGRGRAARDPRGEMRRTSGERDKEAVARSTPVWGHGMSQQARESMARFLARMGHTEQTPLGAGCHARLAGTVWAQRRTARAGACEANCGAGRPPHAVPTGRSPMRAHHAHAASGGVPALLIGDGTIRAGMAGHADHPRGVGRPTGRTEGLAARRGAPSAASELRMTGVQWREICLYCLRRIGLRFGHSRWSRQDLQRARWTGESRCWLPHRMGDTLSRFWFSCTIVSPTRQSS